MKHLAVLNKYFWKYKKYLFSGILFILLSNYFRILSPQVSGFVVDAVQHFLTKTTIENTNSSNYSFLVKKFIQFTQNRQFTLSSIVIYSSTSILVLAILGGFFMFLMRQTIIVMSRHIEYDQKNEIFNHYQQLDINFFKNNTTGDLMNRISEDVSKVRMYTGPALMYFINLAATIGFSIYFMLKANWILTLYVLCPLPILAIIIYFVNTSINKKSEKIQSQLSALTTTAQESYSGIRVIKSFVQEKTMLGFFTKNSTDYKKNAIGLARLEAIYFPSMALLIGLSTLIAICMGCLYAINYTTTHVTIGTITEFVIYVNMLTFPVSAIGWTASMVQRAAASQKRLNEFLHTKSAIDASKKLEPFTNNINQNIVFNNVSFTYTNTGITALKNINAEILHGNKVLIMGKTGSGKTTLAQLLLKFYTTTNGSICINNKNINNYNLQSLRQAISYVPQDVFLFSDTIANNIGFAINNATEETIVNAAKFASIHNEILNLKEQYNTIIGERGVTLSGGQKQRISIARALIKNPEIIVFDDCLSAVDAKTEQEIVENLNLALANKTTIIIAHRIFTNFKFDKIIVLDKGEIIEQGSHNQLLQLNGFYADIFKKQTMQHK